MKPSHIRPGHPVMCTPRTLPRCGHRQTRPSSEGTYPYVHCRHSHITICRQKVRWDTINTTQRIAESHLPAFLEHQGLGHGVHDPDMHRSVGQQKPMCQAAYNFITTHGVDGPLPMPVSVLVHLPSGLREAGWYDFGDQSISLLWGWGLVDIEHFRGVLWAAYQGSATSA